MPFACPLLCGLFTLVWNVHSTTNSTNTYALFLQGETLFRTVIEVTGGGGAAGASGGSSEAAVRTALEDYMARLPNQLHPALPVLQVCFA